jgi:hypothetical protein
MALLVSRSLWQEPCNGNSFIFWQVCQSTELPYAAAVAVAALIAAAYAPFGEQYAVCLCVVFDSRSARLDQATTPIG